MSTDTNTSPQSNPDAQSVPPPPITPAQYTLPALPQRSAMDKYQTVADTVGGPSLRIKDNLVQALIVILSTLLGAGIGFAYHGTNGALIGGVSAMILSTLLSGLVIMILGLIRASNKRGL